jgi:tetratricopeptide (TPR) repeat protein
MTKKLCLLAALVLSLTSVACTRIQARLEIRQANEFYVQEQYADALKHYEAARRIDPGFADLDRLIGYSNIGLFKPEDASKPNQKFADAAIVELQRYLQKRPKDEAAREALINLFLNADRTGQAIEYFKTYLKDNPADLNAVKSVATLYAKKGDFNESLNWYEKITLLDSKNPESFYTFGVVCYEKAAKNPPQDITERLSIIGRGKQALAQAIAMNKDYFEAIVYMNLLYREEAKIETDPTKQQELIAQADVYRNRAMEINRQRKAEADKAAAKPAPPAGGAPAEAK